MLSAYDRAVRKPTPARPKPRSYKSELRTGCPVFSRTRDMVPSPHALSQISPLNFSFSIRAKVAHGGVGKKSGPSRSANRFIVGLKPPFRLYVASAIRISPVPEIVTESELMEDVVKMDKSNLLTSSHYVLGGSFAQYGRHIREWAQCKL